MLRKLNCYVTRASIFLIMAALIAGMAGCPGDDYTRPSRNLEIQTWYDLDDVRDNLDGNHILMNDLDSTTAGYTALASPTAHGGKGWEPLGNGDRFTGSFDGQGYEIRDLFINRPEVINHPEEYECYIGLFGRVGDTAVIEDIGVVNAAVTGIGTVGGLVGENRGTVSNSYFTGSVTGVWNVGGLVGYNRDLVSNSYSSGDVTGDSCVGGLVGLNEGTVSNSHYNYDEALINGENIITIGALFGEDFEEWLANDNFLDVNGRLSQEDGYYVVNNVTDFKELLAFGQNATLKFRLKNDLDLGDEPNFYISYLAGEFDGNGHKISNLTFNFDFVSHVGLFGYLAPGGTVTDLATENVNITGDENVGGLVGTNAGTVSDSYSTGSVSGDTNIAGLVGYNSDGTVSNSYFTGSVTGNLRAGGLVGCNNGGGAVSNSYSTCNVTGNRYVGGLVGDNLYGTVSNSNSAGSVTGNVHVGGLVGFNWGIVSNSHFTGTVIGTECVGGLVGAHLSGTVSNSHATGNVTGQVFPSGLYGWHVGGLIGSHHDGAVNWCYFTGTVIGTEYVGGLVGWSLPYTSVYNSYSAGSVTGVEWVGGLAGQNGGTASNSYSTSTVTGNHNVGGLVGVNYGTASNSYSTGTVSGDIDVGGLVGKNTGTASDSFWDIETSGQATSDGGTGKTTADMQDIATFSGAGWYIIEVGGPGERNHSYVWNIVNNVTYPFLGWQP